MTYCEYCGCDGVSSEVCNDCRKIVDAKLSHAEKAYRRLLMGFRKCCGALVRSEPEHFFFHGKGWEDSADDCTVEYGVNVFDTFAQAYYLIDTGTSEDGFEYGEKIPLPQEIDDNQQWGDFLAELFQQFFKAAATAREAGWVTCEVCGKHVPEEAMEFHRPQCVEDIGPEDIGYNESLDAQMQIDCEEAIAALIFDRQGEEPFNEEDCADLGRDILKIVLAQFRRDLIA